MEKLAAAAISQHSFLKRRYFNKRRRLEELELVFSLFLSYAIDQARRGS
jgi:hypothetical protein